MADDNPIVGKAFIHSLNITSKFGSDVVVKERLKYADGSTKPNVCVINNPRRSFYITQKKFRNYKYKPEYELLSRLDKYTCFDHELNRKVSEVLEMGPGFFRKDQLFRSPYIFGADISIEALIKMRYLDLFPDTNIQPSVGFLDIETSIDTEQIILISYTYANVVYTAALQSFFFEEIGKNRVPIKIDELKQYIKTNLADRTNGIDYEYNVEVFDTEIKLIAWIFKQIHLSQIDYIAIWNMHFDIPKIIKSIELAKCNPASIFSNPNLPAKYRVFNYHEDKRSVSHFTLKWHWVYSTCASQFIDAMGLYSQCRRTQGFRDKYTLDSILDDEVGVGKLPLTSGSHVVMQRHHFKDYIVYNIFDVIGLRLLEDKNHDILSMHVLAGPTPVNKFATQTTRATNAIYHNLIGKGMVLSACSNEDSFIRFDTLLGRVGGAVISPNRVRGVGINLTI
jgi:hypothetical protein